ncbi:MAG: tubulin-like doman-containing protein [Bacteroides sp.]|nr:tubulin-like doman-containing protein [Bacteroides sp.]
MGRLLFANGAESFNKKVGIKVQKLQLNPVSQSITFHVVCGLAGGTGSGSIVDTVAQLRKCYPDTTNFTIMLYLLLPDEIPNPAWASTANYQPNGYAALTELNAMDYQLFQPWDVGEREYEVRRLKLTLPFYSAYLVTEQNNQNVKFDVQKVVPASTAEFIFQKTVGLGAIHINNDGGVTGLTESPEEFFHRAESGENPKYEDYGSPHSFKFMSYGIKRLAIPEPEIKEFFGYSFSGQAINQLIFNNLSRESGYLAERISGDEYSLVTNRENKTRWAITREHLMLSKPILEEYKKENWRTISDEFNVVDDFRVQMLNNPAIKHNDKLQAIHNCTKQFFEKKFRPIREEGQNGVKNFYENKMKYGLEAIANHTVETIEADLLKMWREGSKSLCQLTGIVSTLIDHLTEEKDNVDKLRASYSSNIKDAERKMAILQGEWEELGILSKSLFKNKPDSIANEYTQNVRLKFESMTWDYGCLFSKELITEILSRLITVKANIDKANE